MALLMGALTALGPERDPPAALRDRRRTRTQAETARAQPGLCALRGGRPGSFLGQSSGSGPLVGARKTSGGGSLQLVGPGGTLQTMLEGCAGAEGGPQGHPDGVSCVTDNLAGSAASLGFSGTRGAALRLPRWGPQRGLPRTHT